MGNRQGGKPPSTCEQGHHKHRDRQDGCDTELHSAVFTSSKMNAYLGNEENAPGNYSGPHFAPLMVPERKYTVSSLPGNRRIGVSAAKDVIASGNTFPQTVFHSVPARRRQILKPSIFENEANLYEGEFSVPQAFHSRSFSVSVPKHRHIQADRLMNVVDGFSISSSDVATSTPACIDRLDNLKRNIEQRNPESRTHFFNNAGFAQLQRDAGYDDYDNTGNSTGTEGCAHQRNEDRSSNVTVNTGVSQFDSTTKFTPVRKLSEPEHFVHRINSLSYNNSIPGAWSKSAENSPVIVRKALPDPVSPVIVQRTPSQSPSVERRFPANAPASPAVLAKCGDSVDSVTTRQLLYEKLVMQQGCLQSRDASTAGEMSLPHSPVFARKAPDNPLVVPYGVQRQEISKEQNHQLSSRTGDNSCVIKWTGEAQRRNCKKTPTLSSCSSSSSENPISNQRLQEDILTAVPKLSTAACSPSTSSPTPILFCPQPKGTPVKTFTMLSQPSTAVVLTNRESQDSLQGQSEQSTADTMTDHQQTDAQRNDYKDTQRAGGSSQQPQSSSSFVTEDTIKQDSQSAVFGSVSPKLLRHRRVLQKSPNPSEDQQTFQKQSQLMHITTPKTFPGEGESSEQAKAETISISDCELMHLSDNERLSILSQSAPSSFSILASAVNSPSFSNKTLGQRIREVINEASVGASVQKGISSPSSVRKHTVVFSKDDSFTDTNIHSTASLSYRTCTDTCQSLVSDQSVLRRKERAIDLTMETTLEELHASSKDDAQDIVTHKSGHSSYLNSSRDSCASCVSDSSQVDFYDGSSFPSEVAELTQANLSRQTEWLANNVQSKHRTVLSSRLAVPGGLMVTSDTSDTLSTTDRDTSSSSKRESSTSTATDDTLTSFKTRSTADSLDYEEGFVFKLPESLVFIRSADKDAQKGQCSSRLEPTIKRKPVHGHNMHELCAELEVLPPKTRKARQRELHVQSQIITARRGGAVETVTHTVREMYSDDSDIFDSKDDLSDIMTSSRGDTSDLPSSRDDLSEVLSSRDDISDLSSSRDDISNGSPGKTKPLSELNNVDDKFSDGGSLYVFHRRDLQASRDPSKAFVDEHRSAVRQLATDEDPSSKLSDSDSHHTLTRRSSSSEESCATLTKQHEPVGDTGPFHSEDTLIAQAASATEMDARDSAELFAHSPCSRPHEQPTLLPVLKTSRSIITDEEMDRSELSLDAREYASDGGNKGKRLLPRRSESPDSENSVVWSYTVYNSSCHSA